MEAKINQVSAVEHELEIVIDETELQEAFKEAYREMRPKLALPGFRPGKAPIGLLKKMHGDSIEGDALEKLAQEKFRLAATEHDVRPIGNPVMTDLHRHTGEGAHVKIAYEVLPEIVIQDFEGMEVEKPLFIIEAEDVDARIRRLRFADAEREVTDVINDDEVVVTMDLHELEPEAGQDPNDSNGIQAYLADPDVLPEIRTAMIGRMVGDKVEVDLPKNPTNAEAAAKGEKGRVEITITGAEKVKLPEMTEEFIKKISRDKVSTEADLRKDIMEELESGAKQRAQEELDESIIRDLVNKHDFLVPRAITYAVLDQMIADFKDRNRQRGYPEEFGFDEHSFRERMWPVAEQRGKWSLLQEKLIKEYGLEAKDEDFDALAEKQAAEYGLSKENLLKFYLKDDRVRHRVETDKLQEWLRSKVKIKEKEVHRHD